MCMWIVDADQIQMSDYNDEILYRTRIVDSFVNDPRMLGIESPKGLGKTFLLKSKRMVSQGKGITCFPEDAMCDLLDKVTLNDSLAKYLEDYTNWVDLWKASICISLHKSMHISITSLKEELKTENDHLYWELYSSEYLVTPCQIMNRLLQCSRNDIRKLQTRVPIYMTIIVSKIRSAVHIFIDKTDQAFRDNIQYISGYSRMSRGPSNDSYWMFAQLALAEAAYSIYVKNAHIRVYFGIRSEALLGAPDDTDLFLQIQSYIVHLEYSIDELRGMFHHYITLEDDKWLIDPELKENNPEKAFTGLDNIQHGYVKDTDDAYKSETVFDYIYRHTLKRPRDVMHICNKLCYSSLRAEQNYEQKTRTLRHVVNRESRLLLQSYIREIGPFVFDDNTEGWKITWGMIDTNVFTYRYAQDICVRINEQLLGKEITCNRICDKCNLFKPFSALYNTGLLGHDTKNNVQTDKTMILFQGTGKIIINTNEELLPRAKLYFLHPMVTNKVEATRRDKGKQFSLCTEFIIGDGYIIDEYAIPKVRAREDTRLNRKRSKSIFLSSTCFDMKDTRKMLFQLLGDFDYNVVMSEANDFGTPSTDINSYDYCLERVEECNGLIYIIGRRFGGKYQGKKYIDLANEIKALDPAMEEPSISMMEYFLAKKRGKQTWVFTTKDIYNERAVFINNGSKSDFKTTFVDSTKVFRILNMITRASSGNWFKTYVDLSDLMEIIRIEFGN